MEILLILVVIAVLIVLSVQVGSMKKELRELKWTIHPPQLIDTRRPPAQPSRQTPVPQAQQMPAPQTRQTPVPHYPPQPRPEWAASQPRPEGPAPQDRFVPQAPPTPQTGSAPLPQAIPQAIPQAQAAPMHPQPRYAPQPQYAPRSTQAGPKEQKSLESWIGRNVLAIVAAVLVFLGLVFLGILLVPHLTDLVKVIVLFAISALLGGVGLFLTKRKKNVFTTVLLGTGCGSMFISILLTHIYFHMLTDIPAFSLLLVWMATSLFLAKVTDSLLVSIIAHVGMVISLIFAFVGGLTDEKVLLLLGYQLASTVVIVVGNVLCFKKTYRFGLFVSLGMIVMVSIALWSRFLGSDAGFASNLPPLLIAAVFVVQFLASTFFSYLLFVSIVRVKSLSDQLLLQVFNKLLWVVSLFLNVLLLTAKLYFVVTDPVILGLGSGSNYYAVLLSVAATLFCLFVHCLVTVLIRRFLDFPRQLEMLTVGLLGIGAVFLLSCNFLLMLVYDSALPQLIFLISVALLFAVIYLVTNNRFYWVFAATVLGFEMLFMVFYGFAQLTDFGTVALSFGYLVIELGLALLLCWRLDEGWRAKGIVAMKLSLLLLFEFSVMSILAGSPLDQKDPISFIILLVTLLVAQYSRFENTERRSAALSMTLRINEFLLIYLAAFMMMVAQHDRVSSILCLFVAALGLLILASRVYRVAKASGGKGLTELFSAIGFTLTIVAVLFGTTSWLDVPYTLSLVIMFTALACIVFGLWSRIKVLRLYGLVVMLISVLKLVILDLSNLDSLMRVVAFIVGGLICFAISALYNYTVKRFDKP